MHIIQKLKLLHLVTYPEVGCSPIAKASQLVSLQYESKGAAGRYWLWEVIRFETHFTPWVCRQPVPVLLTADMGLCLCAIAPIAQTANASSVQPLMRGEMKWLYWSSGQNQVCWSLPGCLLTAISLRLKDKAVNCYVALLKVQKKPKWLLVNVTGWEHTGFIFKEKICKCSYF